MSVPASLSETTSGNDAIGQPYTVTTSWVAIPQGALASIDTLIVKNTDAAHFIQIAGANDGSKLLCKIGAGRTDLIHPDPSHTTLYWKADTASVNVVYIAVEP